MNIDKNYGVSRSNIVYIRRVKKVVQLSNEPEIDEADHVVKIGACWHGQETLRGLSFDEEEAYLPNVLGVSPKSEHWVKATKAYWLNISSTVPSGIGLKLEIGFRYKNVDDADHEAKYGIPDDINQRRGIPINVENYILYRYCELYPRCANDKNDANKSPKIVMYMYSKTEEVAATHTALKSRRESYELYLKMLGDSNRIDNILTLLGENVGALSDAEKEIQLEMYATKQSAKFYAFASDKEIELKSFIERCIYAQELKRIPNTETVVYADNTVLGHTIDECIIFLKNPKNVIVLNSLEARMKHKASPAKDATKQKLSLNTIKENV